MEGELKIKKIPLPNLETQKKIIDELEGYENVINEKHEEIDELENLIENRIKRLKR